MKLRLGGVLLVEDILPRAINDWNESVRLAMTNKAKIGADRYKILAYEDLVAMPEDMMRDIAEFLGIAYEDGLLNPTYLGMPIKANSSFDNKSYGIDRMGTKNRGHNDRSICLLERMKLFWGIFSCHDSIVFYVSNLRNSNLRVSLRTAYYLSLIIIKLFPSASIRKAFTN